MPIDLEKDITNSFKKILELYSLSCMKTSLYIPYNCNKVDDYGWGCAWRCIQMLLSARSENKKMEQVPSFEYLFRNFWKQASFT